MDTTTLSLVISPGGFMIEYNKTGPPLSQLLPDPIPLHIFTLFRKSITGFWLAITLTGISTNFINLRTFSNMGLEDSVTISFFALSLSDFVISSLAFVETLSGLCEVLEHEWKLWFYLPPLIPTVLMACVRKIFTLTTVLITTFLAIQRCLCVVIPFHVKGLFTNCKTYCFLMVVSFFSAVCYLLYILRHRVVQVPIGGLNSSDSQLTFDVLPGSKPYFFLVEIFIGVFLNVGCQVVILVCLTLMFVTLRKSVRFRKSVTIDFQKKENDVSDVSQSTNQTIAATNSKETQAMRQVSLISIIFVITNFPYFAFGIANFLIPEFGLYQPYHNLYHLVVVIMFTAEICNSAINFFVYFNYNTKFKKQCKSRWGKGIILRS